MDKLSYHRHRFPSIVIQQAVWLYFRFALSYRDVEDMLAERGIDVSYETVRRWALKFGGIIARRLRRGRPRPDGRWHLDEVFVSINGRQLYVWRAVDSEGEVLDILVQPRRDRKAALKLMRKLLKKQGSGREFPSAIATTRTTNEVLQITRIGAALPLNPRCHLQCVQRPTPSDLPPNPARVSRSRYANVAPSGNRSVNPYGHGHSACKILINVTVPSTSRDQWNPSELRPMSSTN